MSSSNERLYAKAELAIRDLFADTSVTVETARENLTALIEEIRMLRNSLPEEPDA